MRNKLIAVFAQSQSTTLTASELLGRALQRGEGQRREAAAGDEQN